MWLPLERPLLGTWPATQACALTGDRTSDLLVSRPVLNPLSHTNQGKSLFLEERKLGILNAMAKKAKENEKIPKSY